MSQRVIRVGIAGQGRSGWGIHARWMREVPDQYEIVAVSDEVAERRARAKKELGCRVYETYQELAKDDEVELFVNALPSNLHPKGTVHALKAGRNVVCEKPLATKVKDFDEMVEAAKKARRLFAPFQNSRFAPHFRKIREIVDSGVLGTLVHARISFSGFARRWDWQTKQELWGGNINNTGPHPLDQAVMLFGSRKPNVFAKLMSGPGSFGDADDFAVVCLHGRNAPTVEVVVSSYWAYPPEDAYVVNGEFGGIAGGGNGLRWRYYDPAKAPKQKLQAGWSIKEGFCREDLPWVEHTWEPDKDGMGLFQTLSKGFYDNIYDVLVNGAKLIVKPSEVRRQVYVLEEAHRQNPLPKRRKSSKKSS